MKSTLKLLSMAFVFLAFLAPREGNAQVYKDCSTNLYYDNYESYVLTFGQKGDCKDCAPFWAAQAFGRYPDVDYILVSCNSGTYYLFQAEQAGMKAKQTPKNMSAEEVAKLPGLSKFKPFRGNDDVQISVGAHTLIFHGNEGTASENPLDVCQSEGSQQCKSPNTWVVTKDEKAANGGFRIQPSNDKKAYLCFNGPDGGISVHRNPAKTDECIQWTIVPGQLGKDGEITGYKIFPTKHPDYVLAVDTRSSQVRVDKVNTKADEAGEPDKAVLTNWTFTPGKSKRKVTNQEKVLQNAEQK